MKNKIKIILPIFLLIGVFLFSGCGCKEKSTRLYSLNLEIWGILDQDQALQEIFENYKKANPNIASIEYKKIATDTYQKELIDALASGQGPDIFLINNTWLSSFEDKIVPAPVDVKVVNEQKFRSNFVDVVANDFVVGGKIYAAPLAVNSLGLYYNKDLLNQAGISNPPADWNEFINDVIKLTKIDEWGNIVQSGAAIGTAYNINRSTDILNLLMLQNGTTMIDDRGRVGFDDVSHGQNALNFYTQFAKSGSMNYTWNSSMHYSIDAFSEGRTAMMFNYPWNMKVISDKAPKLNFAIAPVPQFENSPRVNYANYQAFVVAKNKIPRSDSYGDATTNISNETRIKEAWMFLTYLTTKPDGTFVGQASGSGMGGVIDPNFDPAKSYLNKSGEPSARRDLIELQKIDPAIGVFATDNLIAKNWKQTDAISIESIFAEMIDQVNLGKSTVAEALDTAAKRVQNLSQ